MYSTIQENKWIDKKNKQKEKLHTNVAGQKWVSIKRSEVYRKSLFSLLLFFIDVLSNNTTDKWLIFWKFQRVEFNLYRPLSLSEAHNMLQTVPTMKILSVPSSLLKLNARIYVFRLHLFSGWVMWSATNTFIRTCDSGSKRVNFSLATFWPNRVKKSLFKFFTQSCDHKSLTSLVTTLVISTVIKGYHR